MRLDCGNPTCPKCNQPVRVPKEWICLLASDGTITPVNKPITPELLLASKTIRVREVIE